MDDENKGCAWLSLIAVVICGLFGLLSALGVIHVPTEEDAKKLSNTLEPWAMSFDRSLPPDLRSVSLTPEEWAQRYGVPIYDGGDELETVKVIALFPLGEPADPLSGGDSGLAIRGFIPDTGKAVNYIYRVETRHDITLQLTGDEGTDPSLMVIGPDGKVLVVGDGQRATVVTLPVEGNYTIRVSAKTVAPVTFDNAMDEKMASNFSLGYSAANYVSPSGFKLYLANHLDYVIGFVLGGIGILVFGFLAVTGRLFGFSPEKRKGFRETLTAFVLLFLRADPPPSLPSLPPRFTTTYVPPPGPRGFKKPEVPGLCPRCGARLVALTQPGQELMLVYRCSNPACDYQDLG